MHAHDTGSLAEDVLQFMLSVDTLGKDVDAIRKTGSPSHLPAIKETSQKLVSQAIAVKTHPGAIKTTLPSTDQVRLLFIKQILMTDAGSISPMWRLNAKTVVSSSSPIFTS